jgi:hypothetical protein
MGDRRFYSKGGCRGNVFLAVQLGAGAEQVNEQLEGSGGARVQLAMESQSGVND